MKKDSSLPFQTAIKERFDATTGVKAYDVAPEDATYPYITIGSDVLDDIGTKNCHGDELTAAFHVWSRATGFAEAKGIIGKMVETLTASPLQVGGFQVRFLKVSYRHVYNDPDGITRHGVVRMDYQLFQEDN